MSGDDLCARMLGNAAMSRRGMMLKCLAAVAAASGVAGAAEADRLRVAYVEHKTRGGWGKDWQYYGGSNMRKFLSMLEKYTHIRVDNRPDAVSFKDEDRERLFGFPILFMTSNNAAVMSAQEIRNMREYLLRGGFLLGDDCVLEGSYSSTQPPKFTRGFTALMSEVFPERQLEVIPTDHSVYHCYYNFPGLPQFHPNGRWEGRGIFDGDRLMVMLSPNDLCCGWQFSWGEYSQNALKMGINIFVYALTH